MTTKERIRSLEKEIQYLNQIIQLKEEIIKLYQPIGYFKPSISDNDYVIPKGPDAI